LKTLFAAVFLIEIVGAAQTPTPDQTRQIELQKEYLRLSVARSASVLIGFPDGDSDSPDYHHAAAAPAAGKENGEINERLSQSSAGSD